MVNNNKHGKNGYGEKKCKGSSQGITAYIASDNLADPPDDVLKESLKKYAQEGLSRAQKLARLGVELDLHIGCDVFCSFHLNSHTNSSSPLESQS